MGESKSDDGPTIPPPGRPPLPTTRPPLPNRPTPISEKLQSLNLNDNARMSAESSLIQPLTYQQRSVRHSSQPAVIPQTGIRWNFPPESQIPKPTAHSGRVFVYPSGRERGSYINEPCGDESSVIVPGGPRNGNRGVSRTHVPQVSQSSELIRSSNPSSNATTRGSPNVLQQIQSKLSTREAELTTAIEEQDFERCVQLKPRITVSFFPNLNICHFFSLEIKKYDGEGPERNQY